MITMTAVKISCTVTVKVPDKCKGNGFLSYRHCADTTAGYVPLYLRR